MRKDGNGQGGHLRSPQMCGIRKAWMLCGAREQGTGGVESTGLSTWLAPRDL